MLARFPLGVHSRPREFRTCAHPPCPPAPHPGPQEGKFTETLLFDVLGGDPRNTLVLTGTCDYPHISADYRNVFYKKVKARPQTPLIRGQYVISKGVFEFGPLLHSKVVAGRQPAPFRGCSPRTACKTLKR